MRQTSVLEGVPAGGLCSGAAPFEDGLFEGPFDEAFVEFGETSAGPLSNVRAGFSLDVCAVTCCAEQTRKIVRMKHQRTRLWFLFMFFFLFLFLGSQSQQRGPGERPEAMLADHFLKLIFLTCAGLNS
jgi:hypothetical protein